MLPAAFPAAFPTVVTMELTTTSAAIPFTPTMVPPNAAG